MYRVCALLFLFQVIQDYPVVLAANRDERYDRPAAKPGRVDGRIPYLAPTDLRAGGTWIGTNAAGVTAAVTNRRESDQIEGRPSRGQLVGEAMAFGSAGAARAHLGPWLVDRRFNGFHLLVADPYEAFLAIGGEGTRFERLTPGAHAITNLHEHGELELLQLDMIAAAAAGQGMLETVADLVELLRESEPMTDDGFAPCKDHGDRGTRSSTVIARGAGDQPGLLLHADGPPDRTPYEDYADVLRALAG